MFLVGISGCYSARRAPNLVLFFRAEEQKIPTMSRWRWKWIFFFSIQSLGGGHPVCRRHYCISLFSHHVVELMNSPPTVQRYDRQTEENRMKWRRPAGAGQLWGASI